MTGTDESRTQALVECEACGRLYRATGASRPPVADLECHCGADRFVDRSDLLKPPLE